MNLQKHFNLYEKNGFFFLISNFVNPDVKKIIQLYPNKYCILEHDHKYVATRNPAEFLKILLRHKSMIINRDFYKSAKHVFCQSIKHAEVLSMNLEIDNVINLSCSLWTNEQLNLINKIKPKNNKAAIINDSNIIKGTHEANQKMFINEDGF